MIFSQSRQLNFSRTYWITFQDFGITSSVSATSSPSLDNRALPQQAHDVGPLNLTELLRNRVRGVERPGGFPVDTGPPYRMGAALTHDGCCALQAPRSSSMERWCMLCSSLPGLALRA